MTRRIPTTQGGATSIMRNLGIDWRMVAAAILFAYFLLPINAKASNLERFETSYLISQVQAVQKRFEDIATEVPGEDTDANIRENVEWLAQVVAELHARGHSLLEADVNALLSSAREYVRSNDLKV